MSAPATVPITITPEAAARIDELGIRSEVEQMIEHTRQTVPALKRIEVVLEDAYDTWDQPYLTIHATRGDAYRPGDRVDQEWGHWRVSTFPPEVCQHITMMTRFEANNAG
jgi:hypothetical protein